MVLASTFSEQLANLDPTPLLVAMLIGGVIGFERELHGRPAGLRTHILVCMTSTLLIHASRVLPSQKASSAPLGGLFTTTTHGVPGDTAYVFLSFTTYAQRQGSWELILDESTMFLLAMGVLDASGAGPLSFPIPNVPSLRGTCLEIGAATMTPAGLIELTNPAVGIVR